MSDILNVAPVGESPLFGRPATNILVSMLVITQVADQLKAKDTSQLTNDIFRLFQKLSRCFNGTAISTSFVPLLFITQSGFSSTFPSSSVILLATLLSTSCNTCLILKRL